MSELAIVLTLGLLGGVIPISIGGVIYTTSESLVFLPLGGPMKVIDFGKMTVGILMGLAGTILAVGCGYLLAILYSYA